MKFILGFFILLNLATFAQARLGETPEQISTRFGMGTQPFKETIGRDTGLMLREYHKHGFEITVLYSDISVAESYEARTSLSQHQIAALLADNSAGYLWKEVSNAQQGRLWVRTDGATARLRDRQMEFKSKLLLARESNFEKSQVPSVRGF